MNSLTLFDSADGQVSRSWNGTPISRRTTDNYVNATAMCKANGKRWSDYRESDRAERYLQALESVTEISVNGLIDTKIGGSSGGGTYVHPQVAIDLARWISAPFAVWMDGWFLEGVSQVRDTQPLSLPPSLQETMGAAEALAAMVSRVGGDPQQSMAKSLTVMARYSKKEHPQLSDMFLETQRALNPAVDEYVQPTRLLELMMETLGEKQVAALALAAKNAGWIQRMDMRLLPNQILIKMGYQFKGGRRRDEPSYVPCNEGSKYAVTEIRPDAHDGEAKVPQLMWHTSVLKPMYEFILDNFDVNPAT